MTQYVLEILDGPQKGTVFSLEGSRTTIGRKPDNDVVVPDEKCSGSHAEVVVEDGRHVLRDLGSRNGTHLDGRRVEEVVLTPFDTFQIGRVQIVFRDAEQSMAVDDVQVEELPALRDAIASGAPALREIYQAEAAGRTARVFELAPTAESQEATRP